MSQYPMRLPEDLYRRATEIAKSQGVSLNQFFMYAISSAVAGMETRQFFESRLAGKDEKKLQKKMRLILDHVPDRPVKEKGD